MARVLFMTSVYDESDKGNLYVDLVDEFLANGHQVDVVTPVERRHVKRFDIHRYENLQVIRFPCLNFRGKVNLFEKGIATLSLGYQYRHALTRYLKNADFSANHLRTSNSGTEEKVRNVLLPASEGLLSPKRRRPGCSSERVFGLSSLPAHRKGIIQGIGRYRCHVC